MAQPSPESAAGRLSGLREEEGVLSELPLMGNRYEKWLAEIRTLIEQLRDTAAVLDKINKLHKDCVNHYTGISGRRYA